MTMTVLDRTPVAGDAGAVTGERQERPDPEVPERARRRSFTAQYKLEVLAARMAAEFFVSGKARWVVGWFGIRGGTVPYWQFPAVFPYL
jgi:hypothetical protein